MRTTVKSEYDVYCKKADPTLRIAVAHGGGLPTQFNPKDWTMMALGASKMHSDAARDVGRQGYCYFQVTKGK